MSEYGQFCPVAKATELLGEKWTLLILRELFLGSRRYGEFQRGLSRISPTLLTKRLKQLEAAGIVVRKAQQGRKGHEYFLTPVGKELAPIVQHLATWGMRWARGQLDDDELDVEFLMWDIHRRLRTELLAGGETVLCFIFDGLDRFSTWWLVVQGEQVDVCTENPGRNVNLYITTTLRNLVEIWNGDLAIGEALSRNVIRTQGDAQLARTLPEWLGISLYAGVRPGDPAMKTIAADSD